MSEKTKYLNLDLLFLNDFIYNLSIRCFRYKNLIIWLNSQRNFVDTRNKREKEKPNNLHSVVFCYFIIWFFIVRQKSSEIKNMVKIYT